MVARAECDWCCGTRHSGPWQEAAWEEVGDLNLVEMAAVYRCHHHVQADMDANVVDVGDDDGLGRSGKQEDRDYGESWGVARSLPTGHSGPCRQIRLLELVAKPASDLGTSSYPIRESLRIAADRQVEQEEVESGSKGASARRWH
jgi:hypothetical protein